MLSLLSATVLSSAMVAPGLAASPDNVRATLPHYTLFDVGTFGGGWGGYSEPLSRTLNRSGANVGSASTGVSDPFCPDWCFVDGYIDLAFEWHNGTTTNLAALTDGYSSFGAGINDRGVIVGISQNGEVDSATGAPVIHGVRWLNGTIMDLGTLGGTQAQALTVNRSGSIIDNSLNADTNDPFINVPMANCLWLPTTGTACGSLDFGTDSFGLPVTTQARAAIWSKSSGLTDLGTLGGPDAEAIDVNAAGQAVGWTYNSYEAGPSGVPDSRPFIWDSLHGITDLGSLGGTAGAAAMINNDGQVTGVSNLSGDTVVHPFIWDSANGMQDIGSFGGWYSHPNWINERGDIIGISSYADGTKRAFYWHDGMLRDLGTLGTDASSTAVGLNDHGIIVGYTFDDNGDLRGFISDRGKPMVDLNTLIDNAGDLYLFAAYYINDDGDIVGNAQLPGGDVHPVVLVPDTAPEQIVQFTALAGTRAHRSASTTRSTRTAERRQEPSCAGLLPWRFCAKP